MAIVSGYQKMKDYIKQSSGYKLLSRWANANTVECDDAQTVQSKIGGITGISSSLTANSSTQAASTNLTNQLYQNINKIKIYVGSDGKLHFIDSVGADSVIPFSASVDFLDSKYTATSGQWLEYTYTVKENCNILVVIGAFGYNNLSLKRNNVDVAPTAKIDNQYEVQTHLYAYSLYCNKGDVLLANSEPGSYNSRSSICMIFRT